MFHATAVLLGTVPQFGLADLLVACHTKRRSQMSKTTPGIGILHS
jgi:hypothetical protein